MGHCADKLWVKNSLQQTHATKSRKNNMKALDDYNPSKKEQSIGLKNQNHTKVNEIQKIAPDQRAENKGKQFNNEEQNEIRKMQQKVPKLNILFSEDQQNTKSQNSINEKSSLSTSIESQNPTKYQKFLSKRANNNVFQKLKRIPNIKKLQRQQASGPNGVIYECLNCDSGEICILKIFEKTGIEYLGLQQIQEQSFDESFSTSAYRIQSEVQINQSMDSTHTFKKQSRASISYSLAPKSNFFQIKNLHEIRHENIVKYLWVDHQNSQILMECMSGGSVRDLLTKFGNFDERIIQKYIKQVIRGVKELHEKYSIPHGNIKCSNVLVGQKSVVKICDFFNDKFEYQQLSLEQKFQLDIQQIGETVMEMIQGSFKPFNEINEQQIENLSVSINCKDFIRICLNNSQKFSLEQLLEHPFLQVENVVYKIQNLKDAQAMQ